MKDKDNKNLLKISELARVAGVSVSTIHYYVQQGLLTPPVKTARNMAYYKLESAGEIHLIQELQLKKYLPLSAIKLILDANRQGQSIDHIVEMRSFMEDIFKPLEKTSVSGNISFSELIKLSGLSKTDIKALEARGMIIPQKSDLGLRYDDIDLHLAQVFSKLRGFGLKLNDLEIFTRYVKYLRLEAAMMHQAFHHLPDHDKIPLRDIYKSLKDFKECLEVKIFREEVKHFNKDISLEAIR
jgi:DNA-binding transcriptional MerR regulator